MWRWAFWAMVALQLAVFYAPSVAGAPVEIPFADKLVHLSINAVTVWTGRQARISTILLVAVFAGHSVVSELVQLFFLPDRGAELGDVIADLAGVALGALVPTLHRTRRRAQPGTMDS